MKCHEEEAESFGDEKVALARALKPEVEEHVLAWLDGLEEPDIDIDMDDMESRFQSL